MKAVSDSLIFRPYLGTDSCLWYNQKDGLIITTSQCDKSLSMPSPKLSFPIQSICMLLGTPFLDAHDPKMNGIYYRYHYYGILVIRIEDSWLQCSKSL